MIYNKNISDLNIFTKLYDFDRKILYLLTPDMTTILYFMLMAFTFYFITI